MFCTLLPINIMQCDAARVSLESVFLGLRTGSESTQSPQSAMCFDMCTPGMFVCNVEQLFGEVEMEVLQDNG